MGKKVFFILFMLSIMSCTLEASWDVVEISPPWNPGAFEFFNEDTGFAGELRTTNGGSTWEHDWIIPPFGRVWSIQMVSPRVGWLLFQMRGIARPKHNLAVTTNCGDTWTHVYDCDTDFPYITQIRSFEFTDSRHGWIKGESGDTSYFYKTDDGGESWYNFYIDPHENWFAPHFVDSLNGYGRLAHDPPSYIIYRTSDGGSSWDSVSTVSRPAGSYVFSVWCKELSDLWLGIGDYGYTYDCRSFGPRLLLHSADSGVTFDTLLYDSLAGPVRCIAFKDSQGILSDYKANMFYSSDAGETWVPRSFDFYNNLNDLSFRTSDEIWGYGYFSFYKSADRGISWEKTNDMTNITWSDVACNRYGEIGVGCSFTSIGFLKFSSDGGDSWFENYPEVGDIWIEQIIDIEMPDSNNWYVLLETGDCRGVYKTTNAGSDWEMIFNERMSAFPILYLCDIEVTPQNIWLTEGRGGEFFRSSDGGETWDTLTRPHDSYHIFSVGSQFIWVEKERTDIFWHSTNGGDSWFMQSVGGDTLVASMWFRTLYFMDSLNAWGLTTDANVYSTANGGNDWVFVSTVPDSYFYPSTSIAFASPYRGFIAARGLFETTDGGVTWDGVPGYSDYRFNDMDFVDSTLGYAVGEQGLIARYSSSEWIDETNGTIFPRTITLTIYPNPFNSSTFVQLTLNQNTEVEVNLYNLLGEKLCELVNDNLPAGYHTLKWNAESYPSGIYFCKVNTGNHQEVERMLLMK